MRAALHGPVAWACAVLLTATAMAQEVPQGTVPWPPELLQLYQSALAQDAQLRAVRQDHAAALARRDAALGTRWPQVNLSANLNRTSQAINYQQDLFPERRDVFRSYGHNLQLTQGLYRPEDRARRDVTELAVEQARWQVAAAEQALWVRVLQPWFEACQFRWQAEAARADVGRQRLRSEAVRRRWSEGDAARPDAELAEADLAVAQSRLSEAESELAQRHFVLDELAGQAAARAASPTVAACEAHAQPVPPAAAARPLEDWLQWVGQHSPDVLAARRAVEVAHAQVSLAEGAHGPTLDFVANDSQSKQGPSAAVVVGSRLRNQSAGLQLNVPLFAGGSVSAKVREAVAQLGKAEADLDALTARLRQDVAGNWRAHEVARSHALAAHRRVQAQQLMHEAVTRRWRGGQATQAEALAAEQELAAARAEAVRAQAQAAVAQAKLLAQAGGQLPE